MKKIMIPAAAALIMVLSTSLSFAAEPEATKDSAVGNGQCKMMNMDQMNDMHKKMLDQKVKEGKLTPDQAKMMEEHMANMMKDMKCCCMMGSDNKEKKCDMMGVKDPKMGMAGSQHDNHTMP